MEQLLLPKFDYYLDESDPDIVEAAKEDYGRLMEAKVDLLGLRGDGDRRGALNPGTPLFTRVRGR